MQNSEVITVDSKQAILIAAEEILNRAGYAGLSMRELARESGLAKSTLYHYFQDKHQIYLSVIERDMFEFQERIEASVDPNGNAIERLSAMIAAHFSFLNEHGIIALRAIRRSGDLDSDLREVFLKHRSRLMDPMTQVIQEGIDEGLFRPVSVELTAITIFGMVNGFQAQRMLLGEDIMKYTGGAEDLAAHTIALLLDGLLVAQ